MSNVSKSGALANWIDDFVAGFAGKGKKEVTAIKNIKDLEPISWNDDTYYVDIKDNGGVVYNDFGHIVTTVDGAKTLEDVENSLNGNIVVANEENEDDLYVTSDVETEEINMDEIDQELSKVANDIEEDFEISNQEDVEDGVGQNQERLQYVLANFEEIENKMNQVESLQKQVSVLEEKLAAVEQLYARKPTLDDVSTYSHDDEAKQIADSAAQTAESIKKEQTFDLTTPSGRAEYSKSHSIEVSSTEGTQNTCSVCNCDVCDCGSAVTVSENVQKLSEKEEELFKNGICPFTNTQLAKTEAVGNFMGVYSPEGNTEYAVDLTDGSIYFYKG